MPVPTTLASLSTTAASNSPSGGENPFPDLDDHIRAGYAFDAQNRDAIAAKLNASAVSAFGLTLIDDADAATARATLGAVGLTGDQTVAGVKTFSSSPIAPTPTAGDNSTKAATTAFVKNAADAAAATGTAAASAVEAKLLGIGQSWTSVISSPGRAFGTTYTNDTAKPIVVSVWGQTTASTTSMTTTVSGVTIGQQGTSFAGITLTSVFVVPPGATYSVTVVNNSLQGWAELR